MSSREIAKITEILLERDFTIQNWSETWFREMLNIAFEREFSLNVNSLTHHYYLRTKVLDPPPCNLRDDLVQFWPFALRPHVFNLIYEKIIGNLNTWPILVDWQRLKRVLFFLLTCIRGFHRLKFKECLIWTTYIHL